MNERTSQQILDNIKRGQEEYSQKHPTLKDDVERDFELSRNLVLRKLLDEHKLVCPDCGGDDLVWACSNKRIGNGE